MQGPNLQIAMIASRWVRSGDLKGQCCHRADVRAASLRPDKGKGDSGRVGEITDGQINASIVVLEAGQGGRFWKGPSGKEIGCRLPQSIGLQWNINASICIDLQSA